MDLDIHKNTAKELHYKINYAIQELCRESNFVDLLSDLVMVNYNKLSPAEEDFHNLFYTPKSEESLLLREAVEVSTVESKIIQCKLSNLFCGETNIEDAIIKPLVCDINEKMTNYLRDVLNLYSTKGVSTKHEFDSGIVLCWEDTFSRNKTRLGNAQILRSIRKDIFGENNYYWVSSPKLFNQYVLKNYYTFIEKKQDKLEAFTRKVLGCSIKKGVLIQEYMIDA